MAPPGRLLRFGLGAAALSLSLVLGAGPAHAATFAVDSTADAPDANPGNGQCAAALPPPTPPKCTLRAAIMEANALAGTDTVGLPAGTYTLTIAGQGEDGAATGDLDVTDGLTIAGPSTGGAVVDANGIDRAFHVLAPTRVTLSGVTVKNGNAGSNVDGGGIRNGGTLTLVRCAVASSTESAIFNGSDGTLRMDRCTIANNPGRGIFNTGTLRILASAIRANGGGIRHHGSSAELLATGTTINGNGGHGLLTTGPSASATLTNSTISGNGIHGVHIEGPQAVALTNVTVVGNAGGGTDKDSGGTLTLKNTVIAGNPGGNCTGGVTASSYSLDGGASCGLAGPGDQSNADPKLGPLADNGGPTRTHALLADSSAIDAGDPAAPPGGCLTVDQRGLPRQDIAGEGPAGAVCDIGAFEFQP